MECAIVSDQPPVIEGQILIGPLFKEPMRVETVKPAGAGGWVLGLVGTTPQLQEPIKDPARFPWHKACLPGKKPCRRRQVNKVQHYWLEVDALSACDAQAGMTRPMEVWEDPRPYGKGAR
jgi:hypothetical protein